MTTQQMEKLLRAVQRWAAYQDPDSLEDQKTDSKLQADAIEAREALLTLADDLT